MGKENREGIISSRGDGGGGGPKGSCLGGDLPAADYILTQLEVITNLNIIISLL